MAQHIRELMTSSLIAMPATASAVEAARAMRDRNIGDVVVLQDQRIYGIVTDRDIVVRTIAEARDPASTPLRDICSHELTTITPETEIATAVQLMKDHAVRRLPVIENGRPVGIVSLGDLALERDRDSALGAISAASPNR